MFTRSLYSSTVGDCIYMWQSNYFTLFKRCLHTCRTGRLYTNDFNMRIQKFCKCGYTCCKSASSDWNKNIIYKRKLLYDFHSNRTLAGCYCRIIKRMDKCIPFFLSKFQCISTCLIIYISFQNYVCTVTLGTFYFDQRCCCRHNDHCFCTKFMRSISNTLCMISSRCCDQTFCTLFFCKRADLIVCTANLIGSCTLHVFWLQIYFVSREI